MPDLFPTPIDSNQTTPESLSVQELRTEARKYTKAAWIASANKQALIDYLRTGHEPQTTTAPTTDAVTQLGQAIAAIMASQTAPMDADAVKEIVKPMLSGQVDEIEALIRSMIAEVKLPAPIQIICNNKPGPIIEERTHPAFAQVCRLVTAGLPVLLVGPSGTGKTHLAKQVANATGRAFSFNSMSAGTTESHILGRTLPDENGVWKYTAAPFADCYANGGLHLFDEIDAADANLLVLINAALANGHLSIPFANRIIKRHEQTAIIAAANTWGSGANRQYVGRNQLDAATLDRFAVSTVYIDYDRQLETSLADDSITALFWRIRERADAANIRRVVSTRSIVNAEQLRRAGFTLDEIRNLFLTSWTEDEKARVA